MALMVPPKMAVRNVLPDYWAEMLGVEVQQVNGMEVGELQWIVGVISLTNPHSNVVGESSATRN